MGYGRLVERGGADESNVSAVWYNPSELKLPINTPGLSFNYLLLLSTILIVESVEGVEAMCWVNL